MLIISQVQIHSGKTNEELLRNLIGDYSEEIKRLAYSYLKDWTTSDDITQEVFIKCYQKMDTFRGESSYKTWLYKIAINLCKDYLRSKWYRHILPSDFYKVRFKSNTLSPEEQFISKSEDIELSQMVLSLQAKYREIIILYYYEDLKINEIVQLTGINSETIKTRLRRAKKILEKNMKRGVSNGTSP
ncbi:sigma-70 family RNA polymerase sigma factor [Neobacillus sp.]|uniref:sigma-70 family RNA polymerase sigma factor n=1 Tax=Neobacillus sp. TaxID=2675273 RepID=UPI0028A24047|nr:sigma-70 family RNA polymerase sigma factor [Neobacillus sp.]